MENDVDVEKKKDKKPSLFKNIILNNFYQILILIVPLVTTPYVSRVLTPTGVGISSYTNSIVAFFTLFGALGTVSYGTREISRCRDDKKQLSKTFFEIEIITIFTALISLCAFLVLCLNYTEYKDYLWIWSFQIVAVIFDISWLYAGLEKFKYNIIINALFKVTGCVMIFLFVKSQADVAKYIFINCMAMLLGNMSMWLFLPKTVMFAKVELKSIKNHFKETLIYFIPTIATSLYTVLDKTLLGVITKENDYNGQYESATKLVNLCKSIGFVAIADVISSRSSYLFKINDTVRINKLTKFTFDVVLTFSVAMSFGLVCIADVFVPLFFGEGYDLTVTMIYMLAPVVTIIAISYVGGGLYYIPAGKRKLSAGFLIAGSFVNLVFNIILINTVGPTGACISTIIAEGLISFLYMRFCKTYSFLDLANSIWKKIIAGIVMTITVYFISKIGISNLYVNLIVRIAVGAVVYFIVLFILRDNVFKYALEKIKSRKALEE
ncbi:MAG: oligosaccharide flippase family protein [Acholeplasmatales bacterium]|nr:oligosaccharide flippase family protein [Acholeplasmatales bacterium]